MAREQDAGPGSKKIAAFVIVLALSPVALLAGTELAARVALSLLYGAPGKSYGIFRPDPVLGHFPAPDSYNHITTLNNRGYRNDEDVIEPRPSGQLRVVIYGGSTTFCPKLTTQACWSHQLQARLRAGGGAHHQVLNGGVVLWSLGHILERAKRDLPSLKADAVILYSGFNESANAGFLRLAGTPIKTLVAKGRFAVAARNYPSSDWLYFHSILFKVARGFIASGYQHFFPPVDGTHADNGKPPAAAATAPVALRPAILRNYEVTLERFFAVVRDSGAEPIFVIQAGDGAPYSAAGAKTACRLGVRVLDARQAVAAGPKEALFRSSIHLSEKGAAMLADYLYDRLYKRRGFSACDKIGAWRTGARGCRRTAGTGPHSVNPREPSCAG